ncbi:hypothetical protein [Paraburkholderia sediminicola]|uniref:hypothetical protein n=1 Tax=Paraburkholderia sediminicola TaxID=458836 RepID=UPI0038BC26C0
MLKPAPHGGFVRVEVYHDFPQWHIVHLHWQHRVPPRGQLVQQLVRERAHFMLARCLSSFFAVAGQRVFDLERFVRLPESENLLFASPTSSGIPTSVAVQRALFNGYAGMPAKALKSATCSASSPAVRVVVDSTSRSFTR